MKKLEIDILKEYKSFKEGTHYSLVGDLIILSGINGSGKSQLLSIIANDTGNRGFNSAWGNPANNQKIISRNLLQTDEGAEPTTLEEVLLFSFRDNISLGNEFGSFSITCKQDYASAAWDYYCNNIVSSDNSFTSTRRKERFENGSLIFQDNGTKHPSWRSIIQLVQLIKEYYPGEKAFHLTQEELNAILPPSFIWRDENDIISQVGNLFYLACCERADQQIECSKSTDIFDNDEWLKTAPWTVLNQLFEDLAFKYRFKADYSYSTPIMEENPQLRDNTGIRSLMDLSDGEKAILKLALISLDEEVSHDAKLVLFDEYDAPLNPSLTEAFYHVIEKFYIEKGIQVIITTHSPATISLAPEYAQFYEMFLQEGESPQIVRVDQFDYSELRIANKQFYDRIKDQDIRIKELEAQAKEAEGKCLFVEDKYDQIYKISYLKTKGIEDISEDNFEDKFSECCPFSIHGGFSCGGLVSQLICQNYTHDQNNAIICLFDFDSEGYKKFEVLKEKKENSKYIFDAGSGSVEEGLYLKHKNANRFALMIPIPERLKKYVSKKTSSDCFIEIETLLSEEYLKSNEKAELRSEALPFYKLKDNHKNDFWKDLLNADNEHFEDFKPLFTQVEKLLEIS